MQLTRTLAREWKLVTAVMFCTVGAWTMPLDARADGSVAKRWVDQAFQAVRTGSPAIHTGTPGAARLYAMVSGAMYDAVNGIDRAVGSSQLKPWLVSSDGAPVGGNREHEDKARSDELPHGCSFFYVWKSLK